MTQSKLEQYTNDQLLSMKVKDLPVDEFALPYPKLIEKLHFQLSRRGILWRPHMWPSEEWFSPDGVAGFAFPFTLLDPRLSELERKHVGFCEGAKEQDFFKLLAHECGHALDNAYHLRKKKSRQKIFGKSSLPYPSSYIPKPHSRAYVRHLPDNYAQAHPEEDWAETFAVWLGSKSIWKSKYDGWPALKKLNLVDAIMAGLKGKAPVSANRATPLHFREDNRTLREYFQWKQRSLGLRRKNFYSKKVEGLLSLKGQGPNASSFIAPLEKELCKNVSQKSGIKSYVVKHMLRELKREFKVKGYKVNCLPGQTRKEKRQARLIEDLLLRHGPEYVKNKRHRIFM